jgi:tetratricopeptide (TPR) repeat protein
MPPGQAIARAVSFIERALAIEDLDPGVNAVAAAAYVLMGNYALARHHLDRAIAASPYDIDVVGSAGVVEDYLGNHETARQWYERLKRLDPHFGSAIRENLFDHHYMRGEYEQAIQMLDGWRSPPWHMYAELAAAYAHLDRAAEAAEAKRQAEVSCPGADPLPVLRQHAAICAQERDANNGLEGYRKAGFEV